MKKIYFLFFFLFISSVIVFAQTNKNTTSPTFKAIKERGQKQQQTNSYQSEIDRRNANNIKKDSNEIRIYEDKKNESQITGK